MADDNTNGRLERKVREDLEALVTEHPMGESLSELALNLARRLDTGVDDKSVAGIAGQLVKTLNSLAGMAVEAGDDLGADLSAPSDGSE